MSGVAIMGGSSGIGYGIAEAFVKAGYIVSVGARSEKQLADEAIELCDVMLGLEEGHQSLIDSVMRRTDQLNTPILTVSPGSLQYAQ